MLLCLFLDVLLLMRYRGSSVPWMIACSILVLDLSRRKKKHRIDLHYSRVIIANNGGYLYFCTIGMLPKTLAVTQRFKPLALKFKALSIKIPLLLAHFPQS